jgi:hypothetical protein
MVVGAALTKTLMLAALTVMAGLALVAGSTVTAGSTAAAMPSSTETTAAATATSSTSSTDSDSEIVVRARGRLGTEDVDLLVNGSLVASWDLDGSWFKNFSYQLPAGTTVDQVRVRNDSGGWPSAVVVDWVEVNGQRYDSSDRNTLSSGSWDSATGCARGYKQSDWLTCNNSWFDYEIEASGRLIAITARGRLGTENVDLVLNGDQVASWNLSSQYDTYYYRLPALLRIDELRLQNDSGGWPQAVIVDHVTVNGLRYDTNNWRTLSSGSWDSATGCGVGVKFSNWLTCDNSWFDYGVNGFYPKYRVVSVDARGRLGGEQFDLVVNGRKVESWTLTTESQTFYHLYLPDYPVRSVRVQVDGGGWPNAVIVDQVTVDRFEIDSSDGRTRSYGSWDSGTGCAEGVKRSDWLTCSNAWFEYDLRSARDPIR